MATAARTTPNRSKNSAPSFSIAAAEKEVTDGRRPDPFVVELKGGELVTFKDPVLLGFAVAASVSAADPLHAVRTLLSPEDYKVFAASDVKAGVVTVLIESMMDWYGVLDSGN